MEVNKIEIVELLVADTVILDKVNSLLKQLTNNVQIKTMFLL